MICIRIYDDFCVCYPWILFQFTPELSKWWIMRFFDEKCSICANNQKSCSKSTFSQNRRFGENAHTDRILMGHSDINERIYPYVHDENTRFSRIPWSGGTICKYGTLYVCLCVWFRRPAAETASSKSPFCEGFTLKHHFIMYAFNGSSKQRCILSIQVRLLFISDVKRMHTIKQIIDLYTYLWCLTRWMKHYMCSKKYN